VSIIRPSRRVFRAIGNALGILTGEAVTEFEIGPVKPRLDVAPSIEAGAELRTFILQIIDVGANTTFADLDFFDEGDWSQILLRNRVNTVANLQVPAGHEGWVIGMGVTQTASALTRAVFFRDQITSLAGAATETLYFGDIPSNGVIVTRGVRDDSAILEPLPWWIPPTELTDQLLRMELVVSGAVTTNIMFRVLSAPVGTFKRLY